MDRQIVYPSSIPLDSDILSTNKNVMLALGALMQSSLGTSTSVSGLIASQTAVPSLTINIGPGNISAVEPVDQNAYGSLGADTADTIIKMGFNLGTTQLTLAAPTTAGQSINYLIQAAFLESDTNPATLIYLNPANPAQPYSGPANLGTAQNTQRIQRVQLQALAGAAAATGSQTTPALTAGYVPLYVVTVSYGQTAITTAQIIPQWNGPFTDGLQTGRGLRLGRLLNIQQFQAGGNYIPTPGMQNCLADFSGGGGGGGGCGSTNASTAGCAGGGGQGQRAVGWFTAAQVAAAMVNGAVPVTIGAGGAGGVAGNNNGNTGGTSSFGSLLTALGGLPGSGVKANAAGAGGYFAGASGNLQGPGAGSNLPAWPGPVSWAGQAINGAAGFGGIGGGSVFGVPGGGQAPGSVATNGTLGSGGGGAALNPSTSAMAGGNGGGGFGIIWEFG